MGFASCAADFHYESLLNLPNIILVSEFKVLLNQIPMNKEIMYMNSRKIKLDFSSRKIFVDDDALILCNKLFELFVCFVKHSGMVVTRTQLLEEVWDRNICWPTNTLDVHVAMLRKKLGKRLGYDVIRTVHCIGYIFEI